MPRSGSCGIGQASREAEGATSLTASGECRRRWLGGGYRKPRLRSCWLSWNERELLLALLQHKCGGRLKNLLGWVLFSPSSHPDIDCRPIGPNVVAAVFVRLPVRPADEAPQPPLIAGSLIKKFPFLGTFYRCVRSRRVIMNR